MGRCAHGWFRPSIGRGTFHRHIDTGIWHHGDDLSQDIELSCWYIPGNYRAMGHCYSIVVFVSLDCSSVI